MSAALKLEQQNGPALGLTASVPEKVSSGIKYYDEVVFPKIEKKQKVFNWYAGLFSPFWFAYKGMWKSYATWVLPYILGNSIVEMIIKNPALQFGMGIGLIIGVGQVANKDYYNHCKLNKNSKSNVWAGVGGLVITLVVTSVLEGFVPAFTKSFNASYTKSRNASKNKEQLPQSAQPTVESAEESYNQSSMAIMDGEKAIGKGLSFTGYYLGIQTVDETPVVMVSDLNGGAQWLITFGEQYKPTIAQLKVGGSYQFVCRIMKIDTFNVCQME